MATLIDILDRVTDELATVAADDIGLANPYDHVGLLDRTADIRTPFLGFEWQKNPNDVGFGPNIRTVKKNYDNSGSIESITKARDYTLILDIGVVLDGDRPRERDTYLGHVENHFSKFVANPCDFHEDVSDIIEQGSLPDNIGAEHDVGVRTTYDIEYKTTRTVSVPAAETINWDLDVDGTDAYPEEY